MASTLGATAGRQQTV